MVKKNIIPFLINDVNYDTGLCEVECVVNLDNFLEGDPPIIEKRAFDIKMIVKDGVGEGDIGYIHLEINSLIDNNGDASLHLQVFYGPEIEDMFLPIMLTAYRDTRHYNRIIQRHRDKQLKSILN